MLTVRRTAEPSIPTSNMSSTMTARTNHIMTQYNQWAFYGKRTNVSNNFHIRWKDSTRKRGLSAAPQTINFPLSSLTEEDHAPKSKIWALQSRLKRPALRFPTSLTLRSETTSSAKPLPLSLATSLFLVLHLQRSKAQLISKGFSWAGALLHLPNLKR